MRRLYHIPLSPFCRKVRIALAEKGLGFELRTELPWERRPEFLALNPAAEVPVLVEEGERLVIADSQVICEYLDEAYPDRRLMGFDPALRAETRRLIAWFDHKFQREVTAYILYEKVNKRLTSQSSNPSGDTIRAGQANLRVHMNYIAWLVERRRWLAGEEFGLADIVAAAQLSCLDYLGAVPWDDFPAVKEWYAPVKSRPSFRPILADRVAGLTPPAHYLDLDF